jgi:hypothetical protein
MFNIQCSGGNSEKLTVEYRIVNRSYLNIDYCALIIFKLVIRVKNIKCFGTSTSSNYEKPHN